MDEVGIASVGAAGVDTAAALDPSTLVDASFASLSLLTVVSLFSFISLSFVVLAVVFDVTTDSNCVRSLGGLIENVGAVVEISILPLPPPLSMSKLLLSLDIVVTFVVGVVILMYRFVPPRSHAHGVPIFISSRIE